MRKLIKQGSSIIDFGNMHNEQISDLINAMNKPLYFSKGKAKIEEEYDEYIQEIALYKAEDGMHGTGISMIIDNLKSLLSFDEYKKGKRF